MSRERLLATRLFAVFLAGACAFHYPLMALFAVDRTVAGVPLLYLYLFAAWLALIVAIARLGRRR